MARKVQCTAEGCTNLILPSTAQETGGPCKPGIQAQTRGECQAFLETNRLIVDRSAGLSDPVRTLQIMEDRPRHDPLIVQIPNTRRDWELYHESNVATPS